MKNLFNSVKVAMQKSNMFDLSHDVKMSLQMGKLYPTCCIEAVPGDKFNISCESLLRFSPLVAPVLHRMDVTMHYFFCPNRILWPNWEEFITNNPVVPGLPPARPYVEWFDDTPFGVKSLANYLGLPIPTLLTPSINVSAFPFAVYQKIWDEYYRDQNVTPSVWQDLLDGNNGGSSWLYEIRKRAWEHDYFTSALPWPQKGAGAVQIPVNLSDAPVVMENAGTFEPSFMGVQSSFGPGSTNMNVETRNVGTSSNPNIDPNQFYVDNTGVGTTTTINDLRRSFRLQEWLEKNARGGSRYVEMILSHFGVKSSDARLNRPEYITGTKSPVVVSEVLNTAGGTLPQGNMAGHGISVTSGQYGKYYCEEHGWIMGIMSVMPKTGYQQGVARHWSKEDPTDYYWPSFANIGEQEIKIKELYTDTADPERTFGYIPRYAEYKHQSNRVAGDFSDTLDFWHLSRIFSAEPNLNTAFIESDPSRRIFAITDPDEDTLYAHVLHKIRALRKMPVYGTPTF